MSLTFLPFLNKIFRIFQIEKFGVKFDENGRKLSKQVENTVGKGEIAHYEQFFQFSTMFSKVLYYRHVKTGLVWERVNKNKSSVLQKP